MAMTEIELVCVSPDGERHAVVVTATAAHRVADLRQTMLQYLDSTAITGPLYVGATPLSDGTPLLEAGLTIGTVVGLGRPLLSYENGVVAGEIPEIAVVGGLHGGPSRLLHPAGELHIGRGGDADLRLADREVSRRHGTIATTASGSVRLVDTGSHNGIRWRGWRLAGAAELVVGDVAWLGETVVGLRPTVLADADLTHGQDSTLLFNRPPRIAAPAPVDELLVPVQPGKPSGFRFPWLTVLLPLLFGGVLYLALPNAGYFLLIMLLSPVMVIANVIGDRRSGRNEYAARKKEYDLARGAFDDALASACLAEEHRTRQDQPDPSWVVSVACAPSARLWERRRTNDDFLRLRLGLHDRPAGVRLRFDPRYQTVAQAELPEVPAVHGVPANVDLREAGVLGVAGDREFLLASARAALVQAAALQSPKDLGIIIVTGHDEGPDWEWVTWLPHTRPRSAAFDCRRLVATNSTQVESRFAELRAMVCERTSQQRNMLRQGRSPDREFLVVVDGARRMRGLPGLSELLTDGPAVGVYALCLDDDEKSLPDECAATLVATGSAGARARLRRTGLPPIEDLLVDGLEPAHAARFAHALAPVELLGGASGDEALPERVRFTELAGLAISGDTNADAELIRSRWMGGGDGRSTRALLGTGPSGPLTVDLRRDGPHALVAGTSGAGKSELLQTLIASLALANTPDALTFVLVDYKGGSAFAACADLPHCVGLITDLDGHLVSRALDSLSAELRRREVLLAEAGTKDIEDYWARGGTRLPRLVIVVDEFASLVEEVPGFVPGVIGIGMRGRSIGVHVVLATQRPGGVVTPDMRANLNLRICLRVTADSESADVIDSPDAARITARQPGRAYLRTGHNELTKFQAGRVGWPRPTEIESGDETQPVLVRPRIVTQLADQVQTPAGARTDVDADGRTDLTALVSAIVAAAERMGSQDRRARGCHRYRS
jgi:S-DNA-T family DNA segregation ATPase FtsK/SpoIIIE